MDKSITSISAINKFVCLEANPMNLLRLAMLLFSRTGKESSWQGKPRQVLKLLLFLVLLIVCSLGVALRRYGYLPASPPHWISPKQEDHNWDQGGADRSQLVTREFKKQSRSQTKSNPITQKSKQAYSQIITAPFLSISSSFILPLWIPVPGGWYIINFDLIILFNDAKIYISYKIAEKIRGYLVEDWRANNRKKELLYHWNNLIDRGHLRQIEFFRSLLLRSKWLVLPGYCYSSEWGDLYLSWSDYESFINQKEEIIQFIIKI